MGPIEFSLFIIQLLALVLSFLDRVATRFHARPVSDIMTACARSAHGQNSKVPIRRFEEDGDAFVFNQEASMSFPIFEELKTTPTTPASEPSIPDCTSNALLGLNNIEELSSPYLECERESAKNFDDHVSGFSGRCHDIPCSNSNNSNKQVVCVSSSNSTANPSDDVQYTTMHEESTIETTWKANVDSSSVDDRGADLSDTASRSQAINFGQTVTGQGSTWSQQLIGCCQRPITIDIETSQNNDRSKAETTERHQRAASNGSTTSTACSLASSCTLTSDSEQGTRTPTEEAPGASPNGSGRNNNVETVSAADIASAAKALAMAIEAAQLRRDMYTLPSSSTADSSASPTRDIEARPITVFRMGYDEFLRYAQDAAAKARALEAAEHEVGSAAAERGLVRVYRPDLYQVATLVKEEGIAATKEPDANDLVSKGTTAEVSDGFDQELIRQHEMFHKKRKERAAQRSSKKNTEAKKPKTKKRSHRRRQCAEPESEALTTTDAQLKKLVGRGEEIKVEGAVHSNNACGAAPMPHKSKVSVKTMDQPALFSNVRTPELITATGTEDLNAQACRSGGNAACEGGDEEASVSCSLPAESLRHVESEAVRLTDAVQETGQVLGAACRRTVGGPASSPPITMETPFASDRATSAALEGREKSEGCGISVASDSIGELSQAEEQPAILDRQEDVAVEDPFQHISFLAPDDPVALQSAVEHPLQHISFLAQDDPADLPSAKLALQQDDLKQQSSGCHVGTLVTLDTNHHDAVVPVNHKQAKATHVEASSITQRIAKQPESHYFEAPTATVASRTTASPSSSPFDIEAHALRLLTRSVQKRKYQGSHHQHGPSTFNFPPYSHGPPYDPEYGYLYPSQTSDTLYSFPEQLPEDLAPHYQYMPLGGFHHQQQYHQPQHCGYDSTAGYANATLDCGPQSYPAFAMQPMASYTPPAPGEIRPAPETMYCEPVRDSPVMPDFWKTRCWGRFGYVDMTRLKPWHLQPLVYELERRDRASRGGEGVSREEQQRAVFRKYGL